MSSTVRLHVSAAALLLACCCLLATGCGGSRSDQYRLEGDTYLRLGRIDDATASYEKALATNPENAWARLGLGRCREERGEFTAALKEFEAALTLDPALEQAYAQAVKILLRPETLDEPRATALAEQLEKANPVQGGTLRAMVLQNTGKQAEARTLLEELRGKFPDSSEVRLSLAVAYMDAKEPALAETELRYILEHLNPAAPESRIARTGLIRACQMQGKAEEMVVEFEELLKAAPEEKELKEGLARSLLYAGRFAEAESLAMELLVDDPTSVWANYVKGAVLLNRKENEEAIDYLRQAELHVPEDRMDVRNEISEQLLIARNMGGEGAAAAPNAVAAAPGVATPSESASWKELWNQAEFEFLLSRADEFLANDEPLLRETLLLCSIFKGDSAAAGKFAAPLPEDSHLRAYMEMLDSRDFDKLIALFTDWKEDEADTDRALLRENALAYALGRAGMRDQAARTLQAIYKRWPDNVVALYNLAAIFRASQQPRFAARALQLVRQRYAVNLRIQLLQYQILREGNLLREARNVAATTYVQFPEAPEAILRFAESLLDGQEPELAQKLLERAKDAVPGNAQILGAVAKVYLHMDDTQSASAVLEQMDGAEPRQIAALAATIAAMEADWSRCIAEIEKLSEAERSPGMHLLRAAALAKADRRNEARSALEALPAESPFWQSIAGGAVREAFGLPDPLDQPLGDALQSEESALADFLLGVAFEAMSQQNAAMKAYLAAESVVRDEALLAEMMMQCLGRSCTRRTSLDTARDLAERHAEDAGVWLAYATLMRLEEVSAAEFEAIEKARQAEPQNPSVWLRRGQYHEEQDDLAAALDDYKQLVAVSPEDPAGNNNVAYLLLWTGGDAQEALDRAARAKERYPQNANILHTLGLAQLETEKLEESATSLRLAMELRPGDPTIMLDYGRLLIARGEKDEGLAQIDAAVKYADILGLEFPRRDEAQQLIQDSAAASPAP